MNAALDTAAYNCVIGIDCALYHRCRANRDSAGADITPDKPIDLYFTGILQNVVNDLPTVHLKWFIVGRTNATRMLRIRSLIDIQLALLTVTREHEAWH